jgi:hypothetical protein
MEYVIASSGRAAGQVDWPLLAAARTREEPQWMMPQDLLLF